MSAVDWILLSNTALQVGDLVSADAGGMPVFRVLALRDREAVVVGDQSAAPQTMPVDRFTWKLANAR